MKKDLRVIKTESSLRQALLKLLKLKPLEQITVSELCRLANINRGTFYLHYKDVHGVFKHYLEVIVEDFRKAYEKAYYKTNFKIENIEADMIEIFHHVKKYKDFYQIIFDEHIPMMYYYLLFDAVSSFMKESLDRYTMERVRNVEVNFLISYQTNAILGILIEWNREEYKTPIKELNEELIAILSMNSPFRQMN